MNKFKTAPKETINPNSCKRPFVERVEERRQPGKDGLTYVPRDRRWINRRNRLSSIESLMKVSQFLEKKGIADQEFINVITEALTKNPLLGLENRGGLSAFFDRGLAQEDLGMEEMDKNKVFSLIIDAKGLGLMPREEGDEVLKILSRLISEGTEIALGSFALVAAGGDEIVIVVRDIDDLLVIKNFLETRDSNKDLGPNGQVIGFTITEVIPKTPREHRILSAALYLQCPLEIEEVRAVAADETRYEELLVKALIWRRFREYVKSNLENQKKVLEIMAKTNAVIGLTLDLILELGCMETVILNCISPMLFSSRLSVNSSIDYSIEELVSQICKTNVIKSGPLAELALQLGDFVLAADPKPKIANMLGLSYGDIVIAGTFETMQAKFCDEELKYITPVTIGPMLFFILTNPDSAKCIQGYEAQEYRNLIKKFREEARESHNKPIVLSSPTEIPVTTQTLDARLHSKELEVIGGIVPGLLDYIKSQLDKGWCIDLTNLLDTPKNLEMLNQLIDELKGLGEQTTKEYCKAYVESFMESGDIQRLNFAKAIMMINRTEGYIDKMIPYLALNNPNSKLIAPINQLLEILVTEKSQQL